MLGYLTEIDLKKKYVRTTFGKETRTFCYDDTKFPLVEALKISAEDAHNQVVELLKRALETFEVGDLYPKPKAIFRARDNWVLCTCNKCGALNYVEPHGTSAVCKICHKDTEHSSIPNSCRDMSGCWLTCRPPKPKEEPCK